MDAALSSALGGLLVLVANEVRAQLRARQADRDRRELRELWAPEPPRGACDGASCSPGGRSAGGCGCDELSDR